MATQQPRPHAHSLRLALALAENIDEDHHDYQVVRELKIQLRACVKDHEEDRKAA